LNHRPERVDIEAGRRDRQIANLHPVWSFGEPAVFPFLVGVSLPPAGTGGLGLISATSNSVGGAGKIVDASDGTVGRLLAGTVHRDDRHWDRRHLQVS
jgi:hypothetical protein